MSFDKDLTQFLSQANTLITLVLQSCPFYMAIPLYTPPDASGTDIMHKGCLDDNECDNVAAIYATDDDVFVNCCKGDWCNTGYRSKLNLYKDINETS